MSCTSLRNVFVFTIAEMLRVRYCLLTLITCNNTQICV